MSGFKYELTQILTLIYQAKKENLLTDEERKTIKEHIITSEPDLTVEMEKYNSDKDLVILYVFGTKTPHVFTTQE